MNRWWMGLGLTLWMGLVSSGCSPSGEYFCGPRGPAPTPTWTFTPTPMRTPCQPPTATPTVPACSEVTSTRTVFNAFEDFSFASNPIPDGAWKYGQTDTLGGPFTLYTFQSVDYQKDDPVHSLSLWQGDPVQYDPNVMKNESGVDMTSNEGSWVFHPATVYLHFHPGPAGQYSVVRWVCPSDGDYVVDAAFRSLRVGGPNTTVDVHVLLNDVSLFSQPINAHYADGEFPYAAALSLKACDTLDFVVGFGDNANHYYDSSGLRAVVARQ